MKKFYCCDYCDELFETEAECRAHEVTCSEKKDYDESRKMDKDSLILHLREFMIASISAMTLMIAIVIVKIKRMMKITMITTTMKSAMKISSMTFSALFM